MANKNVAKVCLVSVCLVGFIIMGAIAINLMVYAPDENLDVIKSNNTFELKVSAGSINGCDITNYKDFGSGSFLVLNCPSGDVLGEMEENAKLYLNGSNKFTACTDDVAGSGLHVFKCYLPSLDLLNGFEV